MSRVNLRTLWMFVVILASLASACQGDASRCTPGATLQCACTDGRLGAQRCNSQGTLEACVCSGTPATPDDGGGSDASANVQDAIPSDTTRADVATEEDVPDAIAQNDAWANDVEPDVAVIPGDRGAQDAGAAPGDLGASPPDAGAGTPAITGSFVGGQVVSSTELSGQFSWGAPVYATGGGITLEGSFQ